jgi:hypothetical protein
MNKELRYNHQVNTVHFPFKSVKLPFELVNIVLEYDGRIKYKYKKGCGNDYHKYVNVIHKHDERYDIIRPIICKKHKFMKDIMTSPVETSFYFDFAFENKPNVILIFTC